jgi:hypothetical protein
MAETTYLFHSLATGDGYDVQKVIDGNPCQGCMGTLTGKPGSWDAEWVDGSKVGVFDTPLEAAKALDAFFYVATH